MQERNHPSPKKPKESHEKHMLPDRSHLQSSFNIYDQIIEKALRSFDMVPHNTYIPPHE